jgi:chromate transporter
MTDVTAESPPTETTAPRYTLWQLVGYMLGLGTWGFGGPVALVGYMYRDLVEKRGWITESDYKEGMALAQLMPGPLAAQRSIYLGYVHYRILGATLVGIAFVLPSFIMVVILGAVYVAYGGIGWMQSVFYGVGAAVIGIIAMSAWKLTSRNIGKDRLLWAIFLVSLVLTMVTQSENVFLFLGSGFLVWFWRVRPKFGRGGLSAAATPIAAFFAVDALDWHKLGQIARFFAYAGSFVFGSGLAIVPFLYGGVVKEYAWLTDRQFVDAVAVAMARAAVIKSVTERWPMTTTAPAMAPMAAAVTPSTKAMTPGRLPYFLK